ncbi:MAG: hypothetical protein DWQ29_20965 [Planctomycetota bacterium]|nr:MAG: hypothetical protein DWQ29_20965 [Planctomycetota bacterium]
MLNFVEQDHEFFDDLGSFMVDVLSEVYQEHRAWVGEYLDLVTPRAARKIGERNAEIMGLCLPTWNRGVLPFHVRLQIAEHDDFVRWCECRVGEKGCDGRLLKGDWDSSDRVINQMYALDGNPSAIDWFYKATFGDRG